MRLSREGWIIVLIGFADLATTLLWVNNHGAQEANPIFRRYLDMGPIWFSLMKMVMLLCPVFLLEWARRRRPHFATWGSRFAIAAYLSLYLLGVVKLNPQLLNPGSMYPPDSTLAQVDNGLRTDQAFIEPVPISLDGAPVTNLRFTRYHGKYADRMD